MKRSAPVTWDQVRVGGFLMVVLTILALGVFFVGELANIFGERYRVVTLMESAAGLAPGAVVQLAGQPVGQVERVEWIDPEDRPETGETVAIWLAVNRDVQAQIRRDSRAHLRTQGLLGDRLIDITPGTAVAAVLEPGDTLPSAPAVDFESVLARSSDAVSSLTRLTDRLEELTRRTLDGEGSLGQLVVDEGLYENLTALSGRLGDMLGRAEAGEGSLGRLATDPELYDRLVSLATSLDTVAAEVASGEGSLGRLLRSDSLYVELEEVAGRSNALLRQVQEGRGSAGKLVGDDALYEELLRTLVDFNAILQEVRDDPRKYIPPVRVF